MKTRFEIDAEAKAAIKEVGRFAAQIQALTGETAKAEKATSSFGAVFKGTFASGIAQQALSGVVSGVAGLGRAMIQGNAEMESYLTQFEVMLGSTDAAKKKFAELKEFAEKTPFAFTDLAQATQTMLAFGISSDEAQENLQMLGDISGGNAEKLSSLTLAFSQMTSSGRLMGQDLLQMINAGFNPLETISEKTGKSMAALKKEMEGGKISVEMVRDAFVTATSEGGKFHGMMEKQSQTFAGLWSTLQDNVRSMLVSIGGPLFEALKPVLKSMVDLFGNPVVQQGLKDLTAALASAIVPLFEKLGPIIERLSPVLAQVVAAIAELVGKALKAATPLFDAVLKVLERLVPVFLRLAEVTGNVLEALEPLIEVIANLFVQNIESLLPLIEALVEVLSVLAPLLQALTPVIVAVTKVMNMLIVGPMAAMVRLGEMVVAHIKFIIDNAKAGAAALASIFGGGDDGPAPDTNYRLGGKTVDMSAYRGSGALVDVTPGGAKNAAAPARAAAVDPKAADKARKALDAQYKAGLVALKREEDLATLQYQLAGRTEEEIHQLRLEYAVKRILLAQQYKQDADTVADAQHESVKMQLERELDLRKEALDKERDIAKQREDIEKTFRERRERAEDRAWDVRKKQIEEDAKEFAKVQQQKRDDFEDMFAAPVADLAFDTFANIFDAQYTNAERSEMLWQGLQDIAVSALKQIATTFLQQQIMSLATTLGLLPAQIATAATTATAWAPAAAAVSLATFGANAAPAMTGITSTYGLTHLLSAIPLAEGGLLDRPTFVAGEAGAEVVAPLSKLPGMIAESVRLALSRDGGRSITRRGASDGFAADVSIGVDALGRGSRKAEFRKMRRAF